VDIRTKLIFALVAVALSSMFVFVAVITPNVEGRLRAATLAELDELAEAKRESLHWIVQGWIDRTALIASRTQLRARVADHRRTGSEADVERIRAILTDALGSLETITLLRVTDPNGEIVASATRGSDPPLPSRTLGTAPDSEVAYAGVEFVATGLPQVSFVAPLRVAGERVGDLLAVYEARELIELTGHNHGLGETGEVLVVAEDAAGALRTLHPTRQEGDIGAGVHLRDGPESLGRRALEGDEGPFDQGVLDYRSEQVWAATRLVPETGWGLVVKVDSEEQEQPVLAFQESLRTTAVVLAAFAILAGFALGLRLAIPIHELAAVANRIRRGDMSARARVTREDEVGLLARTFNDMAGELQSQMEQLHEFRRFFDVSVDMMCLAGTDGYFKLLNPAFERELGWSPQELLERPFFDFVHPDDLQSTEDEVAKLSQGIPTISFENRFRCKDGHFKRLRWATSPDAASGMLYAIAHVMEDLGSAT